MSILVDSAVPVTLVGGGPVTKAQLSRATGLAPLVIAADGGFNRAHALGQPVALVIGDMDSIAPNLSGGQRHLVAEQNTTDLDKCLYSTRAPYYIGVGFLGGRIDHELAALHSLVVANTQRVILCGTDDLCFLAPRKLQMALPEGTRLSLFPMGVVRGHSEGLKYPLDDIAFAPDGMIGTSNEVVGPVTLEFDAAAMLVILPVEFLETVLTAMST